MREVISRAILMMKPNEQPRECDIELQRMRDVNTQQNTYYEVASRSAESPGNSKATNLWRRLRARAFAAVRGAHIQESIWSLHREWLGDIANARVLDLGCGAGNALTAYLAQHAREYVAVDLSETRIEELRRRLRKVPGRSIRTHVGDFLDPSFPYGDFDVVYAMAVCHHFRYLEAFLLQLKSRMSPAGLVVTYDPLQTWVPIRIARAAFRGFQTDREWEFPFTHRALRSFETQFDVLAIQGVYGASKWAIPLSMISPTKGTRAAVSLHQRDLAN